jgi:hypothetical protein
MKASRDFAGTPNSMNTEINVRRNPGISIPSNSFIRHFPAFLDGLIIPRAGKPTMISNRINASENSSFFARHFAWDHISNAACPDSIPFDEDVLPKQEMQIG